VLLAESRLVAGSNQAKMHPYRLAPIGALVAGAYVLAPSIEHGPVICPLRAVTGLSCPTCGATRAFTRLSRGDLLSAIEFNPIMIAALLALPIMYFMGTFIQCSQNNKTSFKSSLSFSVLGRIDYIAAIPLVLVVALWTIFSNLQQNGIL
jgi:hypothetical protein